jgi:prepilin-type N-terminal cleavage/methylation domain-containing protein
MGLCVRLPDAVSRARRLRSRLGFTLAEVLVVIVLGTAVAAALYNVLVYQQQFYSSERDATMRHDALRLAASVLTADLMEASAAEGDFGTLSATALSLRSPVGFGIACAVDTAAGKLALFGVRGRWSAAAGDSLVVYHPNGWLARAPAAVTAPASESCPYAGGPTAQTVVQVSGSLGGVPVGAPVRAFHRYRYRLVQERGNWWLARDDGNVSEILAGPFSGDGNGLTFAYRDAAGNSTTDPTQVARVDLVVITEHAAGDARRDTLATSVRPRNQ